MDVLDIKEVKPRKRVVKPRLALKKSLSVSQSHNQKTPVVQLFDNFQHLSDSLNGAALNLNAHNLESVRNSQDELLHAQISLKQTAHIAFQDALSHPVNSAGIACTSYISQSTDNTLNYAGTMSNPATNLVFNSESLMANTSSHLSNCATTLNTASFFNASSTNNVSHTNHASNDTNYSVNSSNYSANSSNASHKESSLYFSASLPHTESVAARPKSTIKTVASLDLSSSLATATSDEETETKSVKPKTTRKCATTKSEPKELDNTLSSEKTAVKPATKRTRVNALEVASESESTELKVSKSPVRRSRKIVFEPDESLSPDVSTLSSEASASALEVEPPVKTVRRRVRSKLKTETSADLQQTAELKDKSESLLTEEASLASDSELQSPKKVLRLQKKSKVVSESALGSEFELHATLNNDSLMKSLSAAVGVPYVTSAEKGALSGASSGSSADGTSSIASSGALSARAIEELADEGARLKAAAAQLDASMRQMKSQEQSVNLHNAAVLRRTQTNTNASFHQPSAIAPQAVDDFGATAQAHNHFAAPSQTNNEFDDFGRGTRQNYRPKNMGRKGRALGVAKRPAKEFNSISELFKHLDVHEKEEEKLEKKAKSAQDGKYVPVESSVAEDLMKENGISLLQAAAMAVYQDSNPASRQDIKKQLDADREAEKLAQEAKIQAQRRAADIISNVKSLLASKNSNAGTYGSQAAASAAQANNTAQANSVAQANGATQSSTITQGVEPTTANLAAGLTNSNLASANPTANTAAGNNSFEQRVEAEATSVSGHGETLASGHTATVGRHAQTAFSRMHLNEPASHNTSDFSASDTSSKSAESSLAAAKTNTAVGSTGYRSPVNPLAYKFPNDPAKQSKFDALSQSLSKALSSNSEEFAPPSPSRGFSKTATSQPAASRTSQSASFATSQADSLADSQNDARSVNQGYSQGSGQPFPERSSLFEQLSKLAKKASQLDAKSGSQFSDSEYVDEQKDSVFNSDRYAQDSSSLIDNTYAAENDFAVSQDDSDYEHDNAEYARDREDSYEQDNADYYTEYEDESRFAASQYDDGAEDVEDNDSWSKESLESTSRQLQTSQLQSEIEAEEALAWQEYANAEANARVESTQINAASTQTKYTLSLEPQSNAQTCANEEISSSKQRMQRLAKIAMSKKALLKPEEQKPMSTAQLEDFAKQEHIKLETADYSYNPAANRSQPIGKEATNPRFGVGKNYAAQTRRNYTDYSAQDYADNIEQEHGHAAFAAKQAITEPAQLVSTMTVVGIDTWQDDMICCLDRTNPDSTVFQTSKLFVVSDTGLKEFKEWVESNQVSTIILSTHGQDFYQKVQSFCQNNLSQVVVEVAPWNETAGKKIEARASFRLAQDCAIAKRLKFFKRDSGSVSQEERLDLRKKARNLFQTRNEKFKLRRAIDTILNRSRLEITSHFEDCFAPEFMELLIHAYELKDDDYALEDYIYELYETDEQVDQDVIYRALHDDLNNHQEQIAELCEQFKNYTQVLDKVEQESVKLAMGFSDEYLENYENLLTIPSISSFAAVMILGEIGCNTQIVTTARQLESQVLYPERSQFNEYLHDIFLGCARRVAEDKHNRLYPLFMISINNMPPEQALLNVAKKLVYSVFGVLKYHCDFTAYQQEFKKFIE